MDPNPSGVARRMGTCPIFKSRKTKFYTPPITPSDEWYPNTMLGHITGGDSLKLCRARSNSSSAIISALEEQLHVEEQFHDAKACMPEQTVAHSHTHTYGPLSLIETHSVTITHHHGDLELGSTSATPTGSSVQLNRCQLQQQLLHPTPAVRSAANSVVGSEHPSPRASTSLQNSVTPAVVVSGDGGGADQSGQPQGVSDSLQGSTTSVAYRQPFTCSLTHSPSHNNVLINHANSF